MKALKFVTALMGVLIVLGTTVLIVTVVHRIGGQRASGPAAAPVAAGPAFAATLPGGAGAHIAGIAAVDGRLAVWLAGGTGEGGRVVLVDPATGKVVGTLAPGAP